jgi:hypothetical protein
MHIASARFRSPNGSLVQNAGRDYNGPMEALAEQVVATYLTRGGKVFIVPQYGIPAPGSKGDWSCPDFVALDFEKREVIVVEVTSGADVGGITAKAKDRERQWFAPLRQKLEADGVVSGWGIRFLGFVRQQNLEKARAALAGPSRFRRNRKCDLLVELLGRSDWRRTAAIVRA